MNHIVDPRENIRKVGRIGEVEIDDLDFVFYRFDIGALSRREIIDDANGLPLAHQFVSDMRADESCAAGDYVCGHPTSEKGQGMYDAADDVRLIGDRRRLSSLSPVIFSAGRL